MNVNKINEYIIKEHNKQLEHILTNISIHYNINKKELFEKFLYIKNTTKKYKNKKKHVDKQYICMAKTQNGCQCSRSKHFGDYCGKHSKHKNKCPLRGYIVDTNRSEKEEEEYIKSGCFMCNCEPKLGRITQQCLNKTNNNKPSSNSILVRSETINNKPYLLESDTQIVFDNNIKKPTVIGKKLSENEIFFI